MQGCEPTTDEAGGLQYLLLPLLLAPQVSERIDDDAEDEVEDDDDDQEEEEQVVDHPASKQRLLPKTQKTEKTFDNTHLNICCSNN